jgi:hypothetical protein
MKSSKCESELFMSDRLLEMVESALVNVSADPSLSSSESVRLLGEFEWDALSPALFTRIEDVAVIVDWRSLVPSAKYRGYCDIRGVVQAVTDQDAAALREHSGASNYSELVASLLLVVAVLRDAA